MTTTRDLPRSAARDADPMLAVAYRSPYVAIAVLSHGTAVVLRRYRVDARRRHGRSPASVTFEIARLQRRFGATRIIVDRDPAALPVQLPAGVTVRVMSVPDAMRAVLDAHPRRSLPRLFAWLLRRRPELARHVPMLPSGVPSMADPTATVVLRPVAIAMAVGS